MFIAHADDNSMLMEKNGFYIGNNCNGPGRGYNAIGSLFFPSDADEMSVDNMSPCELYCNGNGVGAEAFTEISLTCINPNDWVVWNCCNDLSNETR